MEPDNTAERIAADIRMLNARIADLQRDTRDLSSQRRQALAQLQTATGLPVRELGYLVDLTGSRVQQILGPREGHKKSPDHEGPGS